MPYHKIERHSKCSVHGAVGVRHHNAAAFILWDTASTGTGKLICIFGSSTSYYELSGVSQPYTTCKCRLFSLHMICLVDKQSFSALPLVNTFSPSAQHLPIKQGDKTDDLHVCEYVNVSSNSLNKTVMICTQGIHLSE